MKREEVVEECSYYMSLLEAALETTLSIRLSVSYIVLIT